jgi:hypothetical protein
MMGGQFDFPLDFPILIGFVADDQQRLGELLVGVVFLGNVETERPQAAGFQLFIVEGERKFVPMNDVAVQKLVHICVSAATGCKKKTSNAERHCWFWSIY